MNGINTGIFHPTLQGHVSEASLIAPIIAALDWSRAPPIRALSRSCSRELTARRAWRPHWVVSFCLLMRPPGNFWPHS